MAIGVCSKLYPYINDTSVREFLEIIGPGMCEGLSTDNNYNYSTSKPLFCVEAAWAIARTGDPRTRTDVNPCVGSEARGLRLNLNDCNWSSEKARSRGMKELGIAGLGSAHLDQVAFFRAVRDRVLREVLPKVLRACAKHATFESLASATRLRVAARELAATGSTDFELARIAARDAGQYDLQSALNVLSWDEVDDSENLVYRVVANCSAQYRDNGLPVDPLLRQVAKIATKVLVEMKSEGSKFLKRWKEGKL